MNQTPQESQAEAWRTIWQYCHPKVNLLSEQTGLETILSYIKDLEADHVKWQETWNSFLLTVPPEDLKRFANLTKPQAIIEYIKCLQEAEAKADEYFFRILETATRAIEALARKKELLEEAEKRNEGQLYSIQCLKEKVDKLSKLLDESEANEKKLHEANTRLGQEIDRLKAQLESRNPLRFD